MYSIKEIQDPSLSSQITDRILHALPKWFGIEEAIEDYREGVKSKYFLALYHTKEAVGLLSIKTHNPYTAEVYLLGILEEHQGKGLGRLLLERAEANLKERDYKFLMVKTLGPSHPDLNYKKTREIYRELGFYPLEELKDLWDPKNPCLLMIKNL